MDAKTHFEAIPAVSRATLKERSIRGGMATLSTQVLTQCITVASVAILARLLTPGDYGCVAMVTALTGFLHLFRELGLSGATIQKQDISHGEVSGLFFINAAVGAFITAATIGVAPLVAWLYGKPELMAITVGLSFSPFFSSLGTQHAALLNRQMRFTALASIQLTTLVAGFFAAFAIAWYGGGYWALVANNLVSAAWGTAGLWIASSFRPRWPKKGTDVRQLLRYGVSIVGFDVAYYLRDNVGKILLGRVSGAQPLGLYDKALSLMMLPIASLRYPLSRVAFPAMSRLADDASMFRTYFVKYCSLLAFTSMPLIAIMYACAGSIIRLLLGNAWVGTVEIFQILAVAGFIETVATLRATAILASGHGRRLVHWGLANAAVTILGMSVGLAWGPKGVAVGYCLSTYVALHPLLIFAFHGTPLRARDFYGAIAKPAVAALAMLATYSLAVEPLVKGPDVLVLSIALPACMMTYLAVYAALPGGWSTLRDYWAYVPVLYRR